MEGKILKDTDVLSNNKIENLSTVHLVFYINYKVIVK